jgi:hypothetical protein
MTITRTTVAAVLASAAVAGVGGGIVLHRTVDRPAASPASAASSDTGAPEASGTAVGDATTPPASTGTGPVTSPVTTSTPPPSASTPPPSARAPLSEDDLMQANDYTASGWRTVSIRSGRGAGQAAVSACQRTSPESQYGLARMYSASVDGGGLYADQWVLDFRERADAQQMAEDVGLWRTECTDPSNEGMKGTAFRASDPVQLALPDGSEGQRWTMDFEQDGHTLRQLVEVVRAGTRVSVAVVSGSPALVRGVDAPTLASRAAARLG